MCSGLRGNAIATLVMRSVVPAVAVLASTSGKNTSWEFSNVNRPSAPVAASSRARSAAPSPVTRPRGDPTFLAATAWVRRRDGVADRADPTPDHIDPRLLG